MFSIYTSLFRAIENKFDFAEALENFCSFAEEVVVCVNTSQDGTLDALSRWKSENQAVKLQIIESDFSYDDPLMDGKIKNASLQATKFPFKIGIDADERLCLRHKFKWEKAAMILEETPFEALLIPSLDLYGDVRNIRWDSSHSKKFKWYLHKEGLFRGCFNPARLLNGKVDIARSDTCELIDNQGDLVSFKQIDTNIKELNLYTKWLEDTGLFVFHLGYADLSRRAHINENFWKKHWEVESGQTNDIPTNEAQLFYPTYPHNLPLWDE